MKLKILMKLSEFVEYAAYCEGYDDAFDDLNDCVDEDDWVI